MRARRSTKEHGRWRHILPGTRHPRIRLQAWAVCVPILSSYRISANYILSRLLLGQLLRRATIRSSSVSTAARPRLRPLRSLPRRIPGCFLSSFPVGPDCGCGGCASRSALPTWNNPAHSGGSGSGDYRLLQRSAQESPFGRCCAGRNRGPREGFSPLNPNVETIIDVGGQDIKIILLRVGPSKISS